MPRENGLLLDLDSATCCAAFRAARSNAGLGRSTVPALKVLNMLNVCFAREF